MLTIVQLAIIHHQSNTITKLIYILHSIHTHTHTLTHSLLNIKIFYYKYYPPPYVGNIEEGYLR